MFKDFFSVVKMVLGVMILIVSVLAFSNMILNGFLSNDIVVVSGGVLGFILLLIFSAYLFYAGWTEFRRRRINSVLGWFGVVANFTFAFIFIFAYSGGIQVFAALFLIVGAHEVQRMLEKKPATPSETTGQASQDI